MTAPMRFVVLFPLAIALNVSAVAENNALDKAGERASYFYLHPTKQEFEELGRNADRFAAAMEKLGNKSDVASAVELARISEKYGWDLTGKSKIADMARQIRSHRGQLANYVDDDQVVDPGKLDIWWTSFFATGDTKYLGKILTYAEYPLKRRKVDNDLLIAYAAAWSFKSNCGQHKAVAAFAKRCLKDDTFSSKKKFLEQSLAGPKSAGHYR